jgi:hypothetical protein
MSTKVNESHNGIVTLLNPGGKDEPDVKNHMEEMSMIS